MLHWRRRIHQTFDKNEQKEFLEKEDLDATLRAQTNRTDEISYESVASLQHTQAVCAVQMSFYSTAAKYNGPLETAHAFIDDDRYDMEASSSITTSFLTLPICV